MNLKTALLVLSLTLCGSAIAGKDDHAPKHGGIVVETKTLDFEIVTKADVVQVYVKEHDKQAKLDGAKGKVTLLSPSGKAEADLAPAGDKLEAKGSFPVAKGTKGVVSVTLAGKAPATARFEIK